jgi:hypothetical protein
MGMNTKVLRMLSKRVQLRKNVLRDGKIEYVVERKAKTGEWDTIARTAKIEKALMKKHNAWLAQLHLLNFTKRLLKRRRWGKQTYFKFNLGKFKFKGFQVN